MAIDYAAMKKEELISLLELRDATGEDITLLQIKIERLENLKFELQRRIQEIINIRQLSETEKTVLISDTQNKISIMASEIATLQELKTKLTS